MGEPPAQERVADAADMLGRCLDAASALLAHRDATGTGMITGGATESAPPWNEAAASALLIPWEGIRDLENKARRWLGLAPAGRGGSAGNTAAALRALPGLTAGLPHQEQQAYIASRLEQWCAMALALPAVDKLPPWEVIWLSGGRPAPDCPYCHTPSLRAHQAYGVVCCLHPNCPASRGGRRPFATIGRDQGRVMWRWLDGTVQP